MAGLAKRPSYSPKPFAAIPAQAGFYAEQLWTPAYAGVTM